MKECAIVIPVYNNKLKDYELDSIASARRNFYKKNIYIICPENLDISSIEEDEKNVIRIDKKYFENIQSYNKLCTSKFFYEIFSDKGYEYILIHQLDTYTFQNNLDYFINFGYDWYGSYVGLGHKKTSLWYGSNVGNGGYSLRKLSKMIEITEKYGPTTQAEDAWFCGVHKNDLKICTEKIAREFSTLGVPTSKYETMGMHGAGVKNKSYKTIDKKNNIVVYTVIVGYYDSLNEVSLPSDDIDYICFTDNPIKKKTWLIRPIPLDIRHYEQKLQNKYLKMLPHKFLKEYEISLLCDANLALTGNIKTFISSLNFNKYNMFFKTHPQRKCIYDEMVACVKSNRESQEVVDKLKIEYKKEGMPQNYGMFECNFIVRKHNKPNVINLMEKWWVEVNRLSKRDQLSFTYLLWKNSIKDSIGIINCKDIDNKLYKKYAHNKGIYTKPLQKETTKQSGIEKISIDDIKLYRTYYDDSQIKKYDLDKSQPYITAINTNDEAYPLSSKLNKYWSEFALMTEIAKKGKETKYIGFDQFGQKLNINTVISNPGYDVYFNKKMSNKILREQYANFHCREDIENLITIINELYGKDNKYSKALTTRTDFLYESCFVVKWEIFDEFCKFLSEVLGRFDEKYGLNYDPSKYETYFSNKSRKYDYINKNNKNYQLRAFGFLAERLLSIYLTTNHSGSLFLLSGNNVVEKPVRANKTEKITSTKKPIKPILKPINTNVIKSSNTTNRPIRKKQMLGTGLSWY